ncbi:hydrolase 2, exosortase A system-associated [Polaromonas sp. UC242_47]|uniref:hydrolase 2, exosortase A system-associated n=1 Tax=Polaromonas sp. UC242_47 TaxID=3374626 RepID=UPI0037A19A95
MSASTGPIAVVVEPFFFDAPGGRVFAVHHRPSDSTRIRGNVLCVPPFNEEMNRCRSMMTLQAHALAALGFGTLVLDLHGTGDSEGEYRDARWEIWLDDIRATRRWLVMQPGGLSAIWGIRLGAVLAAQVHAELGESGIALVFWQPVLDGNVHLTQFLRVRMAAQLDRPDLPKETTASLRQQLAMGQAVEVAGYEIHPELAKAIDGARLIANKLGNGSHVLWLENASQDHAEILPASKKALPAWEAAGVAIDAGTYTGPAFWQVHERVTAPAIIERTSAWLSRKVLGQ